VSKSGVETSDESEGEMILSGVDMPLPQEVPDD
jgi:hypothetical protein